ncbi:MAG TPA: antibiotic biosynthesis monooxygenase [Caulobacteraceae bacterium]|nr:antibiotic biosynthesis monooxygenase [Caulobacteraceae bacterium]
MRIVISGEVDVAPEVRDEALKGAYDLIQAALAEPGCVHYAWTADLSRPGRIHVFEEWDSEANLAAHLAGKPYQGMLAHLSTAGIQMAVTRKYRVDHVEPVYDPQGRPRADFFTAKA